MYLLWFLLPYVKLTYYHFAFLIAIFNRHIYVLVLLVLGKHMHNVSRIVDVCCQYACNFFLGAIKFVVYLKKKLILYC